MFPQGTLGMTSGAVRAWLRAEGLTVFVLSLWLYSRGGAGWPLFAWLFLVPDASFAGYVAGPRIGAAIYNVVHSYVLPLQLALVAAATGHLQPVASGSLCHGAWRSLS
jgi:hypothetical protein